MSAFFRFENLEADAYFMLSLVNAQKGNQEMVEGAGAEISLGHEYLAETLIERLLISLAVSVRMIEERFRQREIAIPHPFSQQEVCDLLLGTPTPTDEKKSGVGLAAHKLIHAKRVNFYNAIDSIKSR